MPSARRLRFLLVVVMAVIVTSLFFTSRFGAVSEKDAARSLQDFYGRTVNAMDRKRGSGGAQIIMDGKSSTSNGAVNDAKDKDGDGSVGEDDVQMAQEMQDRLRAAEQKAKEQANKKAPLKPDAPSNVIGVGSSAGGQVKKPAGKDADASSTDEDLGEPPEDRKVEVALNEMFKRSPVVIFSKSYCPYSKKAKGVLLEKYTIDPAPYVVELDKHPLGKQLQERLAAMTGRTTVPNVMVNGKSIGGSDEVAELDARRTLIDKIKSMGGKKMAMKERFVNHADSKE